jgi:hypothetical protein
MTEARANMTEQKERPILFSGPMVRALLDGSKTQTRRVVKPARGRPIDFLGGGLKGGSDWNNPGCWGYEFDDGWVLLKNDADSFQYPCPYGQPGDRLWVRENGWERPLRTPKDMQEGADTWEPYYFDADILSRGDVDEFKQWGFKRRPSIFMPRWASRITLEITGVRVERLQDISAADALSEGIKITVDRETKVPLMRLTGKFPPALYIKGNGLVIAEYASLWETINGAGSWAANPWVWVVEFKRKAARAALDSTPTKEQTHD